MSPSPSVDPSTGRSWKNGRAALGRRRETRDASWVGSSRGGYKKKTENAGEKEFFLEGPSWVSCLEITKCIALNHMSRNAIGKDFLSKIPLGHLSQTGFA